MEREQAQFGPNSWLIEEMYQQYLDSPDSVSEPWRDFFADYSPDGGAQAQPKTPAPQEPKPETKKAPEHTKTAKKMTVLVLRIVQNTLRYPTAENQVKLAHARSLADLPDTVSLCRHFGPPRARRRRMPSQRQ